MDEVRKKNYGSPTSRSSRSSLSIDLSDSDSDGEPCTIKSSCTRTTKQKLSRAKSTLSNLSPITSPQPGSFLNSSLQTVHASDQPYITNPDPIGGTSSQTVITNSSNSLTPSIIGKYFSTQFVANTFCARMITFSSNPSSSILQISRERVKHKGEYPPVYAISTDSKGYKTYYTIIIESICSPISHNLLPAPSQNTRHARRLYLGGLPKELLDEQELMKTMSYIISLGLYRQVLLETFQNEGQSGTIELPTDLTEDQIDYSYILSIYINFSKHFAFVELNDISLTSSCISLDNIILFNSPIKVMRANEYKPDLLTPSDHQLPSSRLNLTSISAQPLLYYLSSIQLDFQCFDFIKNSLVLDNQLSNKTLENIIYNPFSYKKSEIEKTSLLHSSINSVSSSINSNLLPISKATDVFLLSLFPNDLSNENQSTFEIFHEEVQKQKFGAIEDPEFDVDLSLTRIYDLGFIANPHPFSPMTKTNNLSELFFSSNSPLNLRNKNSDSTITTTLSNTLTYYNFFQFMQQILAGIKIPFFLFNDEVKSSNFRFELFQSLPSIFSNTIPIDNSAPISSNSNIKVIHLGSSIPNYLLTFFQNEENKHSKNKFKFPYNIHLFGTQGSFCTKLNSTQFIEAGGNIKWLKDIDLHSPEDTLKDIIKSMTGNSTNGNFNILVTIDLNILSNPIYPSFSNKNQSHGCFPRGLSYLSLLNCIQSLGSCPYVHFVDINPVKSSISFSPSGLFYHFMMGFNKRLPNNPFQPNSVLNFDTISAFFYNNPHFSDIQLFQEDIDFSENENDLKSINSSSLSSVLYPATDSFNSDLISSISPINNLNSSAGTPNSHPYQPSHPPPPGYWKSRNNYSMNSTFDSLPDTTLDTLNPSISSNNKELKSICSNFSINSTISNITTSTFSSNNNSGGNYFQYSSPTVPSTNSYYSNSSQSNGQNNMNGNYNSRNHNNYNNSHQNPNYNQSSGYNINTRRNLNKKAPSIPSMPTVPSRNESNSIPSSVIRNKASSGLYNNSNSSVISTNSNSSTKLTSPDYQNSSNSSTYSNNSSPSKSNKTNSPGPGEYFSPHDRQDFSFNNFDLSFL